MLPVSKLDASDARNNTVEAISSGLADAAHRGPVERRAPALPPRLQLHREPRQRLVAVDVGAEDQAAGDPAVSMAVPP